MAVSERETISPRWLDILAEFNYTLEHQVGVRHGNAKELSCHESKDWWQRKLIEQRNSGPSRLQVGN